MRCDKGQLPGTRAKLKCKPSYRFPAGVTPDYDAVNCQADGTWDWPLFKCIPGQQLGVSSAAGSAVSSAGGTDGGLAINSAAGSAVSVSLGEGSAVSSAAASAAGSALVSALGLVGGSGTVVNVKVNVTVTVEVKPIKPVATTIRPKLNITQHLVFSDK